VCVCVRACVRACVCVCTVTTENDMRASEMTKAIFREWQARAHSDKEEGRGARK